jgi:hypothetical protein
MSENPKLYEKLNKTHKFKATKKEKIEENTKTFLNDFVGNIISFKKSFNPSAKG